MSVAALAGRLPDPRTLLRWARALAVLDALLSPEWELRYFSFDAAWAHDEEMASMRNGQGDDWSITFMPAGTYVRGFDHESALSPYAQRPQRLAPGLLDGLPDALRPAADEPAFTMDDVPSTTVALWRLTGDGFWSFGSPPSGPDGDDGGTWLFAELDGKPGTYRAFAAEYYERDVGLDVIRRVFAHEPLTAELMAAVNPEITWEEVADEVSATGYPVG